MPWAPFPTPPRDPVLDRIAAVLDPVLVPLGFAPGQTGVTGTSGQVIFCRGLTDSVDGGCVDLVLELEAMPGWRITDVRYDGFPAERWHLVTPSDSDLESQLIALSHSLEADLH